MTLEEIGRRAVALTDARSLVVGCHAEDRSPGDHPCHYFPDEVEYWCDACKDRERVRAAIRAASRRLSDAVKSYRAARDRRTTGGASHGKA